MADCEQVIRYDSRCLSPDHYGPAACADLLGLPVGYPDKLIEMPAHCCKGAAAGPACCIRSFVVSKA